MTKYSKYNIVYHLQKWMDSVPGQTFLNYAYSWGAVAFARPVTAAAT